MFRADPNRELHLSLHAQYNVNSFALGVLPVYLIVDEYWNKITEKIDDSTSARRVRKMEALSDQARIVPCLFVQFILFRMYSQKVRT